MRIAQLLTCLLATPCCADEPTSGLDSRNQEEVVAFLRELADEGCTVVTTVHGPSSSVYARFDSVLLLVRCADCTAHAWRSLCCWLTL